MNFDLSHPAVVTIEEILPLVQARRAKGEKMVFTNGCYDILHPGHVNLLARAAQHGDYLVLGLNTDASVKRLNKGTERPINPCAHRAYVLAHLASISYVVAFDEDTPLNLITALEPEVLIKGGDWSVDTIVGREVVEAKGGLVKSLPLLGSFSTTSIVKKIQSF